MTNLKHVRNCLIQEPFCPPKPPFPQLKVPQSQYHQDILSLLNKQAYTDVVFVNNCAPPIHCHKIILVAASEIFHILLTYHHFNQSKAHHPFSSAAVNDQSLKRCASDISIANTADDFERQKHKLFSDDSLLDVRISRQFKNFFSASLLFPLLSIKHSFSKHNKLFSCSKSLNHSKPRFKLLQQKLITVYKNVKSLRSDSGALKSKCQSVISFGKNIPFEALHSYVSLVYSLTSKTAELDSVSNVAKCLRALDFVDFDSVVAEDASPGPFDSLRTRLRKYIDEVKSDIFTKRLAFFGIEKGLFSDVVFKLEDGTCYGHKAILMARCEVLDAMFKGDFKESFAQMIVFPGVTRETFFQMLYYIYTDCVVDSGLTHKNCLALIELANRFCLTRLIALVEERIISELIIQMEMHADINAIVLKLLEPCQIHNADQLSDFCLYQIAVNYNDICHNNMKQLRALHPENQAYLNRNRWPPVWFLKENDYFERCVREREWNENPKSFKRHKVNSGCFCFTAKPKLNRNALTAGHSASYPTVTYKVTS